MSQERFELTEDHLRLLQAMQVEWCEDESGAPAINPKRPYGNSSVELDIAEILRWSLEDEGNSTDDMSEYQIERARTLHMETENALQICLEQLAFRSGIYVRDDRWKPWRRLP